MLVSGWAAISPYGRGRQTFADGVHAGLAAAGPADRRAVREVPGFDAVTALGKKGTRSMDRLTALAVSTVGELVTATPSLRGADQREDASGLGTALVLGTTTGSAQSMMDFSRSSFTGEKPYLVDPARFPNTVMNCAAGQAAIWYRLRGPNATVGGGRASGLLALNYARRLQRSGRAHRVLCGAAEEWSADRAWLHDQSIVDSPNATDGAVQAVLGEGCAMLLVEPAGSGADGLAEVLAVEFGVADGTDGIRPAVAAAVRRALDRAGARPEEVALVAPGDAAGEPGAHERAAVGDVLGGHAPRWVSCTELIGDTAAAAGTFQIVAALALAERDPSLDGRLALVTAADSTGVAGCVLLRLLPPTRTDPTDRTPR